MKYLVNTPISAGKDKQFAVGEEIDMAPKEAAELVACGALTQVKTPVKTPAEKK